MSVIHNVFFCDVLEFNSFESQHSDLGVNTPTCAVFVNVNILVTTVRANTFFAFTAASFLNMWLNIFFFRDLRQHGHSEQVPRQPGDMPRVVTERHPQGAVSGGNTAHQQG